jgi:chorismate mutase/prephenate dehydratase
MGLGEPEYKNKSERKPYISGYQGAPGSFGEEAMLAYFGEESESRSYKSFREMLDAISVNEIDYGVFPIENSSTGSINEVYDLLRMYDLSIVGEITLKIKQNLLGIKGAKVDDIREVYSHGQGFQQSEEFFLENPQMTLIPFFNTAIGAKHVSDMGDVSKAAVASERAAVIYGLDILKENLNDCSNNYTRFAVVGKNLEWDIDSDKISIILTVANKVGALYSVMKLFAEKGINMIKIESRPIQERSWEYFFYIDIEGNLSDTGVVGIMEEIKKTSTYFRMLGNYKKSTH